MMTGICKHRLSCLVVALYVGFVPVSGFAQLLEDVDAEVVSAEKGAELRIHFNVPVHYLRHTPLGREPADSVEIFFNVVSSVGLEPTTVDETKKLPAFGGLPRFTILVPRTQNPLVEARVILKFDQPVAFQVRPGGDGRSIVLDLPTVSPPQPSALTPAAALPTVSALPQAVPAPGVSDPAAVETQAQALYGQARAALDGGQFDLAIQSLNQVLNLPANAQTRAAQELIGVAREQAGDPVKAKAEYNLFVLLYPTGADTDRVRRRLVDLDAAIAKGPAPKPVEQRPAARRERPEAPPEARIYGSFSTYFYWGEGQNATTSLQPGTSTPVDLCDPTNPANERNLNTSLCKFVVDSRSWMNSFDFNYRYRSKEWDNKFVFRDTDSLDALRNPGSNRNRMSSAYGEIKDRPNDWLVRVGRQSVGQYSITGIMNRFDGILGGWGVNPKFRVNLAMGTPSVYELNPLLSRMLGRGTSTYATTNWKQPFWAASMDLGPYWDSLSGSAYYIQQNTDGYLSRRALGAELRFFKPKFNAYSLIDYDAYYRALNIFMLQANYMPANGVSYNILLDRRRSPLLQLTNAFQVPETSLSIRDLVNASANGVDDVKSNALAATPFSDSASIGASWQINPKWQLGGDFHLSRMTGTPAVQSLTCPLGADPLLMPGCGVTERAAVAATGWDKSYSANLVGSGLFMTNDVGVFSLSYLVSQTFYGLSPSLSYRVTLDKLSLDGAVRFYHQRQTQLDSTSVRWSPSFRASYRLKDNFTFEGEAGLEYATDKNPSFDTSTYTTRRYISLGMRWDF